MMAPIIFFLLLVSSPIRTALGDGEGSWGSSPAGPSESECRPYIEKALQGASHLEPESSNEQPGIDDDGDRGLSNEDQPQSEASESSEILQDTEGGENERPREGEGQGSGETETAEAESVEEVGGESPANQEDTETEEALSREEDTKSIEQGDAPETASAEDTAEVENAESTEQDAQSAEPEAQSVEDTQEVSDEKPEEVREETLEAVNAESTENTAETTSTEDEQASTEPGVETTAEDAGSEENAGGEGSLEDTAESGANEETAEQTSGESPAEEGSTEAPAEEASAEKSEEQGTTAEEIGESAEETVEQNETSQPHESNEEITQSPSGEATDESVEEPSRVERSLEEEGAQDAPGEASVEDSADSPASGQSEEETKEEAQEPAASAEEGASVEEVASEESNVTESQEGESSAEAPAEGEETSPEEELSVSIEIPEKLRSRDHMVNILRLNEENEDLEKALAKTVESTLKDLKKLYDAAIKPLEILYKYRDLSNRHFGDPEIFSKPLILFMGPWSGGKSTIINYLLENEYKKTALRTGAEPSPAYFNIVMWGEQEEVLDGTQLAADWTFSGLQKFGQGLLDRLRGLKLNHPLLEKVNIVEIPGILEIRKQVERLFPFNDACQWFIDRADIIFLVYDPSKLDVGPETEAILDQLKGREMQTRIVLNKADQVKPEELMRVQGTLIWNISPLMSSTEPPVMYSTSLWSIPYESGAPARLLYAQELAFLRDLRDAVDKRVENKIASARRFAVRVRNHAKMVDCYLTTYYNHKTFFGNKKKISDDIIEHPQNYHIYEGLSTLTNISRYDLPDPDVYRDFFRLNPVYEFQQLSSTCTYFRGCPINRLDVAIAYDLPELVGRYKKQAEEIISSFKK